MRLSVIIPALNEEKTIAKVIEKVLKQKKVFEVIVVNDGSTDNTKNVVKKISNPKVKLYIHPKNLGKGAAVKTGLEKVQGDFVLIQDADLEYNPEDYHKLIKEVNNNTVVYGSRIKGKNKRAYNRTYFGNVLLTKFTNFLFGTNLTDSYTCYKLIPTRIAECLNITSKGFELEAEITAKLARNGVKIIEVPITYLPRSYEQGKKIKAKDAWRGFKTLLKIRFDLE